MRLGDHADGLYGDAAVKTFLIRGTGSVRLHGPEIDLVSTREFQRLDGIKQLGTANLVFRSANHTRFEHSLGTLFEVQRIIDAVNSNPRGRRRIDNTGQRLARLLALLHDVSHIPFGHTLEDEFHLLERHDGNGSRIARLVVDSAIGQLLRRELEPRPVDDTNEYRLLMSALRANDESAHELGKWAFVVDLVSNTVCADSLDYVSRDLTGCGMPVALGDRFLDYFVVTDESQPDAEHRSRMALRLDKRGMPRPDVASEVYKLLEHRYELVERVFFHHAKNSASAMLSRAVQELRLSDNESAFDWLTDETLQLVLERPQLMSEFGFRTDADDASRALASQLAIDVRARRLFKLAYLGVPGEDVDRIARNIETKAAPTATRRRAVEDDLANLAGLEAGHVLLHVPAPRMLAKRGRVRVMLDDNDVTFLADWDRERSQRLAALERAHRRLWRISVYVHPAASEEQVSLLMHAAEDRFNLKSMYVRNHGPAAYFGELFDLYAEQYGWPPQIRSRAAEQAAKSAALTTGPAKESRGRDAMLDLLDAAVRAESRDEDVSPEQDSLFPDHA